MTILLGLHFPHVQRENDSGGKLIKKSTYLTVPEPLSVVDAMVGLFKAQVLEEGIFWIVNQIGRHSSLVDAGCYGFFYFQLLSASQRPRTTSSKHVPDLPAVL